MTELIPQQVTKLSEKCVSVIVAFFLFYFFLYFTERKGNIEQDSQLK